jgi:PadR family transcriptional regulator, regulatory protein PadR
VTRTDIRELGAARASGACVSPHALRFDTSRRYRVRDAPMASVKSDLPQGTLDMLILQVVAAGPVHGYGIAQRLQQISKDVLQVQQGSLYPALHRLENRKLLAAEWKPSETGREAKFYKLTALGRKQLKEETANWARLSEAIRLVIRAAESGTA